MIDILWHLWMYFTAALAIIAFAIADNFELAVVTLLLAIFSQLMAIYQELRNHE